MRTCVTGATNPVGEAIIRALVAAGHDVRAFGVDPGDDRFDGLDVQTFPGWVEVGGSLEPVLSERQVLVHAANLDNVKDKRKRAIRIQKGTHYTRYAAEREQVDQFIHVTPNDPGKVWGDLMAEAVHEVEQTRGDIHVAFVGHDGDAQATADAVVAAIADGPDLGSITGGHTNAVTK